MSGSPLIHNEGQVIGIHKMAFNNTERYKGARMITTDLIERLLKWA